MYFFLLAEGPVVDNSGSGGSNADDGVSVNISDDDDTADRAASSSSYDHETITVIREDDFEDSSPPGLLTAATEQGFNSQFV